MALTLLPPEYLSELRQRGIDSGLAAAVHDHDTGRLFEWIVPLLALQGISDRAAFTYARHRTPVSWHEVIEQLAATPTCPRLRCWWTFSGCGYRKSTRTCAEPAHIRQCLLPRFDLRKGGLNVAVIGLALFVRDVCDNDLAAWLDQRLAAADPGPDDLHRGALMRDAVLGPLSEVPGVGRKLWAMVLAELLLGAGPDRERWMTAGATFVVVDTLVHAMLHRTGLIYAFGEPHPYGPACYSERGCRGAVERIAADIDACVYGADYPRIFPRLISRALWNFAAESGSNCCNARRIDDRVGCRQRLCPAWRVCPRLPISLQGEALV